MRTGLSSYKVKGRGGYRPLNPFLCSELSHLKRTQKKSSYPISSLPHIFLPPRSDLSRLLGRAGTITIQLQNSISRGRSTFGPFAFRPCDGFAIPMPMALAICYMCNVNVSRPPSWFMVIFLRSHHTVARRRAINKHTAHTRLHTRLHVAQPAFSMPFLRFLDRYAASQSHGHAHSSRYKNREPWIQHAGSLRV
jgi:hypothetical protein